MRQEYIGIIDKEIIHHKSIYLRDHDISPDFKDGFLKGLEHIRQLFIQVRAAELYPELASRSVDELRN